MMDAVRCCRILDNDAELLLVIFLLVEAHGETLGDGSRGGVLGPGVNLPNGFLNLSCPGMHLVKTCVQ